MSNKFIRLHYEVNPLDIIYIAADQVFSFETPDAGRRGSLLYTRNGNSYHVLETPDEVSQLIGDICK